MATNLVKVKKARGGISAKPITKEYGVVIDGVIEMTASIDDEKFFDGLMDTIIEYVEKYNAYAGLSMSHREYVEDSEIGKPDGGEAA